MSDEDYDDDAYAEAVMTLIEGIDGMLEAGATVEDVRKEVEALLRGRS